MPEYDIYINPNGAEITVDELRAANTSIRQLIETLRSNLNALQSWQGQARDQYEIVQKTWDAKTDNMGRILQGYSGVLQANTDGWRRTDARNTGLWDGVGA
ncbi:WXG100 family type VII secretion target [Streptomyces sp. NPDC050263]|uniref:WXG100 family type VII secretion target n=1 Tax=Streptomyces sp. NPDC050263 TaxID=3155037 RepID=UPI003428F7E0